MHMRVSRCTYHSGNELRNDGADASRHAVLAVRTGDDELVNDLVGVDGLRGWCVCEWGERERLEP